MLLPLAAPAGDREFQEALASYRAQRYSEAFGRMLALAVRGDPDAAHIALFMHHYGPTLYGSYWELNPQQVAQFNEVAASERGRPYPRFEPPWEMQRVRPVRTTAPAATR